MKLLLLLSILYVSSVNGLLAKPLSCIKTKDGVIADTITPNIYSGADASFNLYEDEGTNYNYEKGAFAIIPIKYSEATKTITLGTRKGSFNGMLQKRTFSINFITPKQTRLLDFDAKAIRK